MPRRKISTDQTPAAEEKSTSRSVIKFADGMLAIEALEAKEAGALGFMARSLIQATMPHSKPQTKTFTRANGNFTLTMMAHPKIGLPYGSVPRLLMAWLTTEAVRTKNRELVLGANLSQFMRELGLVPTGGRWGTITRLKDQIRRLFSCAISCTYDDEATTQGTNLMIVDDYSLWWNPRDPDEVMLFESKVYLSEKFFNEIIAHPVPLDMRVLKLLCKSPMALDIYSWLTYRMSYLGKPTVITWDSLKTQFGSEYKELKTFKYNFNKHLKTVLKVYSSARVSDEQNGLMLYPSLPHIKLKA